MKIRNGFVSNSSSSSYIVSVPKGFTVSAADLTSPRMLEDLGEGGWLDDEEYWDKEECDIKIPQKAVDKVNELLVQLASGHEFYRGDYRNPPEVFWGLIEVLEKHNLVVMAVDAAGGDGEDTIVQFKDQRKNKK